MPDDRNLTKQDLEDFHTHLDARFDQLQAEVLRGFHSSARPAEVKLRSHEERLTLLEERISEIERGKGLA
jgi:hypothetical protein